MSRPYLKYRFKELEDILKNKQEDENVDDIINELSFRKSPKAKALYDKIKHRKKINLIKLIIKLIIIHRNKINLMKKNLNKVLKKMRTYL